jgi:hypothetical protein
MVTIHVKQRDRETLSLLSWTQASARLILKTSEAFELPETEEPFRDERRVRERMQVLVRAGLLRFAPIAAASGGVENWYRLTMEGFRTVHDIGPLPVKTLFEPIRVSRQEHTTRLAELIAQTVVDCHRQRTKIEEFRRENELEITGGSRVQYPDCFFRLARSGRQFNFMFELDNGTEPVDSSQPHSIREKILTYEAHQDYVLRLFASQSKGANPRFRVVFLTRTAERAENILALAAQLAANRDRLLCYAAPLDDYVAEADVLQRDIFLDHHGNWQRLVNLHPTSCIQRTPVRLTTV